MLKRLSLVLCLVFAAAVAGAEERPPNVILILVDDLGWMDLSCQGSDFYRTPSIDRLATEGVRFTNAYAACAVCSPTRAAVQTGRYPHRVGVTDWIRSLFQRGGLGTPEANPTEYVGGKDRKLLCPPNPFWMEHEELTIAEALKANDYRSGYIGKWHLGDDLGEATNLAEQMPDKARELDAALVERLEADGAKLPRPNPDFAVSNAVQAPSKRRN